jgi:hypothetical protein
MWKAYFLKKHVNKSSSNFVLTIKKNMYFSHVDDICHFYKIGLKNFLQLRYFVKKDKNIPNNSTCTCTLKSSTKIYIFFSFIGHKKEHNLPFVCGEKTEGNEQILKARPRGIAIDSCRVTLMVGSIYFET